MYLFGGKFCKFVEESGKERECTCPEIVSKHPQCECDRKHFNNILWATVTVFQVSAAMLHARVPCSVARFYYAPLLPPFLSVSLCVFACMCVFFRGWGFCFVCMCVRVLLIWRLPKPHLCVGFFRYTLVRYTITVFSPHFLWCVCFFIIRIGLFRKTFETSSPILPL